MTRRTKTDTEPSKPVLELMLETLELQFRALSKGKDPESLALMIKIGRQYLAFTTELRKHERQEHQITSALSTPLVVQWARTLEPSERTGLVRELQQIDSKRSGLS